MTSCSLPLVLAPPYVVDSRGGKAKFNRISVLAACAVVLLVVVIAASAHARDNPNRTTHLRFSGAVALPNVVLPAGAYLFELAAPDASLDIVRVLSRDRSKVHFTGYTQMVQRPVGMSRERAVVFGEARQGNPLPITAWFPIGSAFGHRFIYDAR